jgi:hypothetical protein
MTTPATDSDLVAMLQERAASVRPHAPTAATIAARSRRQRRRRNAVASAGAATAASVAVVAGAIAAGPANDDQNVAVDVSAPITPLASATAPTTTTPPSRSGPPLRMGLDIADAQVISVSDNTGAEQPANEPPGVRVEYQNAAGTRRLSISTFVASPPPAGQQPGIYIPGVKGTVDLGEGVQGTLSTIDVVPGGTWSAMSIDAVQDGASLVVDGVGLSEDEMLSAARSVVISQRGAGFDAPGVPSDLVAGRPGSPLVVGTWGVRTQVVYRTADGTEIVVDVYNGGGQAVLEPDLQKAKAQPTAALYELSVRGRDAVVRRFPDMANPTNGEIATVTWREGTGHLVTVRFTPPTNTVPDPAVVSSSVQQLTEPEFQALLAAHGDR